MTDQFGVRDDGRFEKKDIVSIQEDLKRHVKDELGDDISLRQNSPIKQLIDAFSIEIARQWDAAEDSYYASFFEDAEGEQLDNQLALAGFSRQNLRPAEGEVVFSRDGPATRDIDIPEGTVVTTERTETRPLIPFETTEDATLFTGEVETDPVPIKALAPWQTSVDEEWLGQETNVSAGTIVRLDEPIGGIDEVTNPKPTGNEGDPNWREGRDRETDAEFKLRYQNSLAAPGVSTPGAVQGSVFQHHPDIISVRVQEVRSADEMNFGVRVAVLAPELTGEDGDDIIAQGVFDARAAGVESFGDESGTAEYPDGRTQTEHFDRAERVNIHVSAELSVANTFPDDGIQRAKSNLIQFIGGEVEDGRQFPGLEIGDEVIYDQVKARIMQVRGVRKADVFIGTEADPDEQEDIDIGDLEAALTDADLLDLEVNYA